MKELKIHNNEKGNLLSIKPFENTFSDRNYLISVITAIFALTKGYFHLQASRPNYEYDTDNLAEQLKENLSDSDSFEYKDSEILFCSTKNNEKLLKIFSTIWFAYEHIAICFFSENQIEFDIKRKSWYEITKNSKSYVLFKGVEDNVIWIGKSNGLQNPIAQTDLS